MKETDKIQKGLLGVGLAFLLTYLIAVMYPDTFWGLHHPAFLPGSTGLVLIVLFGLFTFLGFRYNIWKSLVINVEGAGGWYWKYILALVAAIVYFKTPIFSDVYGDSQAILGDHSYMVEELDAKYMDKLFSLDFTNLKLGTGTTFGLVAWISYNSEITVYEAFRWIGAIFGGGFVFIMLSIVHRLTQVRLQRLLLTLAVLGAPFTLAFCGHVEVYAPVYFFLSLFWYLLIRFQEKPSVLLGVLLVLSVFLNFKFHVTGALTALPMLVVMLVEYRKKQGKGTSWKLLFRFVVLPVYLLGVLVYVFVTKSAFGPRDFTEENLSDAIFLPISSSDPAPLDRYNLFSGSHIFDYFNMFFLWSAAALLVVVAILVFFRNRINQESNLVKITGVSMLIYLPVFFVLNPLLSMQVDWDLMSIPGIALLVLGIVLLTTLKSAEGEERSLSSMIAAPMIGLSVLGFLNIPVNGNQESLSKRLISSGKYSYKTYWKGTSTNIYGGIYLIEDEDKQMQTLERIVKELEPYGIAGNDIELCDMENRVGRYYQKRHQDLATAKEYYEKAYHYNTLLRQNVYDLVVINFIQKDFKAAHSYLELLVAMEYPSEEKALRMAVHTSLEAEEYGDAAKYCEKLLVINPQDQFIREVLELLRTSEDKSQIKFKFSQS